MALDIIEQTRKPQKPKQKNLSQFSRICKIKEAVELPDGDILIGYIDVTDSEWDGDFDEDKAVINYRKLSQLEICWCPEDDIEK